MRETPYFCTFLSDGFLRLGYDSLECFGLVDSEIGKHLAVDDDTCFLQRTHKLAVAKSLQTCGSVDTLDPQRAEVAFLVSTVTESILQTFLPCVLGNCPYVCTATKIASREAHDLLTTVARSNVIY